MYPNKSEERNLRATLETCRWTYNSLLGLRKSTYEQENRSLSKFDCNKVLAAWKQEQGNAALGSVHSQVLQNVSDRVDKAYQGFFRRVKKGEKPGFPRFRGLGWYDSFTYPQSGFSLRDNNQVLRLSKIGDVKIIYHRPIQGKINTCTIRRTPTNKWYVTFSCELPDVEKVTHISNPVGIDCGLNSFIKLSNGQTFDAMQFFRHAEEKISELHRKLSQYAKSTPERRKARKRLASCYEKVTNRRTDYAHHISKQLVENFDCLVFEDLSIDRMLGNHRLAKSIQDAAWNQLVQYTIYKAENAGRWVVLVDPKYTSQTCSACGRISKKSLSDRWHKCECGCSMDRDENAAINILRLGLQPLKAPHS